ncbi:MAG: TetR/AcrR family transcriptional regulator [Deltaproteobacteria bacterium]|nr:TetR/AcrR family transcriptional regulator [Deltaproteobacteria bacterium]
MPRPRFDRLTQERQDAILDAAAAEFGEHGFSRASYNQIIDRAGLSKGAMYYYFEDKQDLFSTLVSAVMDRFSDVLVPVGDVAGPPEFWAEVEAIAAAAWTRMTEEPRVAMLMPALINPRGLAEAPEALTAMHERAQVWMSATLERGRAVGAVRTDLADDLLLGVTFAVGEAIDRWVAQRWIDQREAGQAGDAPTPELSSTLIDLLRRVAAPA